MPVSPRQNPVHEALASAISVTLGELGGVAAVAARRVGPAPARTLPVMKGAPANGVGGDAPVSGAPLLDVAIGVDHVFPAASLAKIPIAIELLRRVDMGLFDLSERLDTSGVPRAGGGGVLDYLDPTTQLTLDDLLKLMLIVSDNTASNILLDLVGMGEVNETMSRLNLPHTRLARRFMDFEARRAHRDNLTTAGEMLTLMELIRGNALPGGRRLREAMSAEPGFSDLTDGWLPTGATLAHKDGILDDTAHDAGILTGPGGACVYCVLTTEQGDVLEARLAIRRVLRLLWDGLGLGEPRG
jgi:beta-lactamase class A